MFRGVQCMQPGRPHECSPCVLSRGSEIGLSLDTAWLPDRGVPDKRSGMPRQIRNGSWSCKNLLAKALTCRDLGEVAMHGRFFRMWLFFRLSALLMQIPAILGGSSTADSHMSAATRRTSIGCLNRDHCQIQKGPVGVERDQYHRVLAPIAPKGTTLNLQWDHSNSTD